jgi:hypothetical protein
MKIPIDFYELNDELLNVDWTDASGQTVHYSTGPTFDDDVECPIWSNKTVLMALENDLRDAQGVVASQGAADSLSRYFKAANLSVPNLQVAA